MRLVLAVVGVLVVLLLLVLVVLAVVLSVVVLVVLLVEWCDIDFLISTIHTTTLDLHPKKCAKLCTCVWIKRYRGCERLYQKAYGVWCCKSPIQFEKWFISPNLL
jgi:hypothetical protein